MTSEAQAGLTITLTPFERDVVRRHLDRGIVAMAPDVAASIREARATRSVDCFALNMFLVLSEHIGFDIKHKPVTFPADETQLFAMVAVNAVENQDDLEPSERDIWVGMTARLQKSFRERGGEYAALLAELKVA